MWNAFGIRCNSKHDPSELNILGRRQGNTTPLQGLSRIKELANQLQSLIIIPSSFLRGIKDLMKNLRERS
jgi:hypothetical protein